MGPGNAKVAAWGNHHRVMVHTRGSKLQCLLHFAFPLKYQITGGRTPFPDHTIIYDTEISGVTDSSSLCLVARYTRSPDGATRYDCTFEFIRTYHSVTATVENAFVFLLATCYPNGKVIVNPGAQESIYMRGWLL